jgi:hypothetical protein
MKSADVTTAIVPTSRVSARALGFRQAVRLEWIKLRTLRSVKWALLVALAVRWGRWCWPCSIICGYAVVLLVVGGWLLSRRDA